ncbi:MAG TPA: hypothetical protein VFY65_12050 [Longimicrobium sp.]|nr:hypothetical protein [Longimicrobium sp.]
MRNWIIRSFGLCALAAALFAPVAKAETSASATAAAQTCTWVNCGDRICCNHCGTRMTPCVTGVAAEALRK